MHVPPNQDQTAHQTSTKKESNIKQWPRWTWWCRWIKNVSLSQELDRAKITKRQRTTTMSNTNTTQDASNYSPNTCKSKLGSPQDIKTSFVATGINYTTCNVHNFWLEATSCYPVFRPLVAARSILVGSIELQIEATSYLPVFRPLVAARVDYQCVLATK